MALFTAFLAWRLLERWMRPDVERNDTSLTGWEKRVIKKPTFLMMTTKLTSVLTVRAGRNRALAWPLKPVQLE